MIRRIIILPTFTFWSFMLALVCVSTIAQGEALDGTAEHLIEVPMDFRYLSLPSADERHSGPWFVQLGAAHISGHLLRNNVVFSEICRHWAVDDHWSINTSVIYDHLAFGAHSGNGIADMRFADVPQFPGEQAVTVTGGSGNGKHYGVFASLARSYDSGYAWQAGLVAEKMSVDNFSVDFNSQNLVLPIRGSINYAANYNALTPFFSFAFPRHSLIGNWLGQFEVLLSNPLPRKGFKGSISGINTITGERFSQTSNTDAIGRGTHIPDPYIGLKYMLNYKPLGLTIDVGASLYSYFGEPKGHAGVDNPIYTRST